MILNQIKHLFKRGLHETNSPIGRMMFLAGRRLNFPFIPMLTKPALSTFLGVLSGGGPMTVNWGDGSAP